MKFPTTDHPNDTCGLSQALADFHDKFHHYAPTLTPGEF
jgi:hypothetical protein